MAFVGILLNRFSVYPLIEEFDSVEMDDIRLDLKNVIGNSLAFFFFFFWLFIVSVQGKREASVFSLQFRNHRLLTSS